MTTIQQLLEQKGRNVACVAPRDTVFHALQQMAFYDVGAVLVVDGGQLVGIFSERDYARKVVLQGKASKETTVREVMTDRVIYVTPENSIDECMALMTEKRVRHLPVLDANQELLGIVSIGDVVKSTISSQRFLIEQLEHYIAS